MARYDFRAPRVHVDVPLHEAASVPLDSAQLNHLIHVLRRKSGDSVLAFNGRDGEWHAVLVSTGKRGFALTIGKRTRPQSSGPDLHYVFAPLKHARLDYMVQKAVELGASRLQPVLTQHVQAARLNLDRMRANAVEAAQQCGILALPDIRPAVTLDELIAGRDPLRLLVFCDEDAPVRDPVAALSAKRPANPAETIALAVLVGPEGGFASEERNRLNALAHTVRLSLGPRILRADTAAIAALALVSAVLGDWR